MKTFSIVGLLCLLVSTALVPTTSAQSNSTVRFRVSYGTFHVGNIDVELFDNDKPVTVSNFLTYAQSGAYSNAIIDYCVANSVVQGGFGTVSDPLSVASFTRFYRIPSRPKITNEFLVGTRYDNSSGTLAMALEADPNDPARPLPNSASTSWFFNLANNSASFDPRLFTVFGRVITGSNILSHFNTLTATNRVIATTNNACGQVRLYPGEIYLPLLKLPVGTFLPANGCPRYSDLYRVDIQMLNARDVVGPNLAVANPISNLIITNATALVSGTAYDNVAVSNVFVEVNGGDGLLVATNSGAWSTNLTDLPGGTNVIVVRAYDTSGNVTEATRRIFHRVKVPISLNVVGTGTISGATNTQLLELGRNYTLTAKPGKGYLFGDWSGSNSSLNPKLTFMMDRDHSLTATFGTNLFPVVQGNYNGLFYNNDANYFEQASSGFLTLKVGSSGASSGKLLLNGGSHSVKGTLNAFGFGNFLVERKGTNPVQLDLSLDITNNTDQLTGTVTEQASTGTVWTAQLVADRAFYDGKINIAPQAGKYTVLFPADTNSATAPESDSFGAVTVTTKGAVSLSGTLADGTKVTQKTVLSKHSQWPLYLPLYKGKGSLISWVNFTNEPTTDVSGLFTWFKQTNVAKYYSGAFTNESIIAGSRFVPPTTNAILNLSNALVTFTGGNLAADFTNTIAIDTKSKVINQSSNKLSLTFSKSSGTFSGSVTPPTGGKAIAFKGAVLQKQTNGAGFFLGTNLSGRVTLQAE